MNIPRIPILGVNVSALNMELALSQLSAWVKERSQAYVCVTPAHAIMECVNDPNLLPVYNEANLVTPDGMSVVWLLRLKGCRNVQRVYGPDLFLAACAEGVGLGWKHYFYGGVPGVAQQLAGKLKERMPGLHVVGTCSPPFGQPDAEQEKALLDIVNTCRADILWVGMSSPWQETWMHAHLSKVKVPVMIGVGAAFDFLAGNKKQAPRWMQRSGLEWLFRLAGEPKRLWPRYRQYPRFVFLAIQELLKQKAVNRS
jgi:N-acetylglucosaminyldiphosphoundecaprenol N-acetyl-beta-D-mannosaminyltransferase